jgi:hypothetical protein
MPRREALKEAVEAKLHINLDINCRVSFTLRLLYPQGNVGWSARTQALLIGQTRAAWIAVSWKAALGDLDWQCVSRDSLLWATLLEGFQCAGVEKPSSTTPYQRLTLP